MIESIKPIVLTLFEETMIEHSGVRNGDGIKLSGRIGSHDICGGWIDIIQISKENKAIICKTCYLRVVIPAYIKTYGELREYFDKRGGKK